MKLVLGCDKKLSVVYITNQAYGFASPAGLWKIVVIIRDENYNENLLFPMKDFLSFGTYLQSKYFMSTRFLKDNIYEVHVPQFQLSKSFT